MIRALTTLLLILIFAQTRSFSSNVVVKNLDKNWFVYDESAKVLLPILEVNVRRSQSLTQRIDLSVYPNDCLTFKTSKGMCFFINNQLYVRYDSIFDEVIPFSSINNLKSKVAQFTFFHPNKRLPYNQISIIKNNNSIDNLESTIGLRELIPLERENGPFRSLLIICLVIMMMVIAYLRISKPVILEAYYDAKKLVSKAMPDNYVLFNSLNVHAVLVQLACSISLAVVLVSNSYWLYPVSEIQMSKFDLVANIVLFTLLFQGVFFVKFYVQWMICNLLGVSNYVRIHYYEFMRLVSLSSFVLLLVNIVSWYHKWPGRPVLYYTLLVLSVLWVIRLTWISLKHLNFRKLYFFSYICSSEIIPIILVLGQLVTL